MFKEACCFLIQMCVLLYFYDRRSCNLLLHIIITTGQPCHVVFFSFVKRIRDIPPHVAHTPISWPPLDRMASFFFNVGVCFRGRAKVCGPLLLLIVGKVPGLYRYIQFEMKQQGLRNKSFCIIPCVCFIMSPWYIQ